MRTRIFIPKHQLSAWNNRSASPLEQLLLSRFSVASPEENDGEWLMAIEIFNALQEGIRDKLPLGKVSHLGRLLKKWEVPNKRTLKGSLYYLKKLPKQGQM